MAGISVSVCLRPEAVDGNVRAAVAAAMAPFDLDADNPWQRGMWDSWRIVGGSDGGGFPVVAGYEEDPRLIHDDPPWNQTTAPVSVPGVCAGGPRALLDLEAPRTAYERAEAASWDLWQHLLRTHEPAVRLEVFVQRWGRDGTEEGFEALMAAYREQPLISAFLDHPFSLGRGSLGYPSPWEHPVIGFTGTRSEYVARMTSSIVGFDTDVVTPDGWWVESGMQPIHAECESPSACPHTFAPTPWPGTNAYLAGLPDDTVIVRLHCHG
ncbi:hypothetical protein ACPA54_15765 [Uniformispora flossi]|uniref:hypothetical protein n=1 Tax=Uniformispora flossi TaxID=3390723 RepID=UPI003C2FD9C2